MANASNRLCYQAFKSISKAAKAPVSSMILNPGNDPFYAGAPAREMHARWFASLWKRFGFTDGVHLRRIHYKFISQETPILRADGPPYLNTDTCWQKLIRAAADARYLGLVPREAFVDRRNDAPTTHLVSRQPASLYWADDLSASELPDEMPEFPRLLVERPRGIERYHVELWAEKTTINDVLLPIASRYGLNVVTGAGELSIPACCDLVERARESRRPVRILYLSDFDPSGQNMPVSVARKIEFLLHDEELDLDVRVCQIVLTVEQCEAYHLPRTPLKDSDRRAASFEARFGEGATELDALEALHPGELERIVRREVGRYRDPTIERRVRDMESEIQAELDEAHAAALERHQHQIHDLEEEYADVAERYRAWEARAETFSQAFKSEVLETAPDLDAVEWPEAAEGDEDPDPLFDSRRDYFDQIDRYKAHQGKA